MRLTHPLGAIFLGAMIGAHAPALANDSTAALGAGGLQLVRNDTVELLSEDLFISTAEVKVTYHFRNKTDAPQTYLVAFPLPPIDAIVPEEMNIVLPDGASENFVDFKVSVDGVPVTPSIEERATVFGIDRTADIKRFGLPLNPIADGLYQQLEALPAATKAELNRLGLVYIDPYSTQAVWRLETIFYWEQTFPPGKELVVEHSYKPVVGLAFLAKEDLADPTTKAKYCFDSTFEKATEARLAVIAKAPNPYLDQKRISYILTTANNWAGAIGKFRLVVDKGDADSLVSFCGSGIRKISPTQFEMTATDFIPDHDLDILIAAPPRNLN